MSGSEGSTAGAGGFGESGLPIAQAGHAGAGDEIEASRCPMSADQPWSCWTKITGTLPATFDLPNRMTSHFRLTVVARDADDDGGWLDVFANIECVDPACGPVGSTSFWSRRRGLTWGMWGFEIHPYSSPAAIAWLRISNFQFVTTGAAAIAKNSAIVDFFNVRREDSALLTKSIEAGSVIEDAETIIPSQLNFVNRQGSVAGGLAVVAFSHDVISGEANLDVFGRSTAGELLHWQRDASQWTGPTVRATGVESDPAAASSGERASHVFWLDETTARLCALKHEDDEWSEPDCDLSPAALRETPVAFTRQSPSDLNVLAQSGEDEFVLLRSDDEHGWRTVTVSSGTLHDAHVAAPPQAPLQLIGIDAAGQVVTRRLPNDAWTSPEPLGGAARSIALAVGPDGIDLVAADQSSLDVWWRRWTSSEGWGFPPSAQDDG